MKKGEFPLEFLYNGQIKTEIAKTDQKLTKLKNDFAIGCWKCAFKIPFYFGGTYAFLATYPLVNVETLWGAVAMTVGGIVVDAVIQSKKYAHVTSEADNLDTLNFAMQIKNVDNDKAYC